ncbi:MAG: hypothetical protein P8Y24_03940 [Gammaproteobacteria bacterium]|jgi:hypothetical protein
MAKADDLILDIDDNDTETEDSEEISSDKDKLNARRRLEEYFEMKKLRELTDY